MAEYRGIRDSMNWRTYKRGRINLRMVSAVRVLIGVYNARRKKRSCKKVKDGSSFGCILRGCGNDCEYVLDPG